MISDPEYDGAYPMVVPIEGKNLRRELSPMEVRNLEKISSVEEESDPENDGAYPMVVPIVLWK